MLSTYLFIELLGSAKADEVLKKIKTIKFVEREMTNAVALSDEKIVAQLDSEGPQEFMACILERISQIESIVQTNLITAVRPTHD